MSNLAHKNHYVPQSTLCRWSKDGTHVQAYRILVSNQNVPEWKPRAISGIAFQPDLYTVFEGDEELDEFECWIGKEFETPGLEAIDRLISQRRLTPADWKAIANFVAAQDVRTPLNYILSMQRWHQEVPKIIEDSIQESIKKLEAARLDGIKLTPSESKNEFSELFRVHVASPSDPNCDEASIQAEVTLGRRFWTASIRHLLTGVAKTLSQHRWSVAQPHENMEWPITDHPVLRLNFYKPGQYDFSGGWGNKGSEIIMPVSPRHLLYVQVGKKTNNRFKFSPANTALVQHLLVERAHRWVFARRPEAWIAEVKPRIVDAEMFTAEENAWSQWHQEHCRAEAGHT
jgi:hypothetical protein